MTGRRFSGGGANGPSPNGPESSRAGASPGRGWTRMNECSWEDRIAAGARAGRMGAEARAHLDGCAVCREVALAVRALVIEAETAEGEAWTRLPDADAILARATAPKAAHGGISVRDLPPAIPAGDPGGRDHTKTARRLEEALRPLVWVERAAAGIAAALGGVALFLGSGFVASSSRVTEVLGSVGEALVPSPAQGTELDLSTLALAAAALVVLAAVVQGVWGLGDGETHPI